MSRAARAAALKRLREQRETGTKRLESFKVNDDDRIYDLVTEQEYNKRARDALLEDDFVVDDHGEGYVAHGLDDWDSRRYSDEDDDDEADLSEDVKSGKRKREVKKKPAQDGNITALFSKAEARQKPQKSRPEVDDSDLMSSIMDELERDTSEAVTKVQAPPRAANARPQADPLMRSPLLTQSKIANLFTPLSKGKESPPTKPQSPTKFEANAAHDTQAHSLFMQSEAEENVDLAPPESEPQLPELPAPRVQVKVKALQTANLSASKGLSKFIPKFERQETATAQATIVGKLDAAGCKKWTEVNSELSFAAPESSQLPPSFANAVDMSQLAGGNGSIYMFWLDIFEKEGSLFLIGKTPRGQDNKFVSCCIEVKNLMRNLFVMPRTRLLDDSGHETDIEVTMSHVEKEFDALRKNFRITEFLTKPVTRKYAFEIPGIPAESEYLKVLYPFSQKPIPQESSGKSFSRIFGTNASAQELFILKRKLMGPCWLQIKNATHSKSGVELIVNDQKDISVCQESDELAPKAPPPLVVMNLSLRTVMNSKKCVNEIVAASGLVFPEVDIETGAILSGQPLKFTVVRQLNEIPFPVGFSNLSKEKNFKVERNERALLSLLVANLHRHDPDVIVGHNFIDFDLDVLLHRMQSTRVQHWSRIGRLKRTVWPKLQSGAGGSGDTKFAERQMAAGRLLCDTYRAAQDTFRAKSYSLTNLAASELKIERPSINYELIPTYFWDINQLYEMLQHCEFDCFLTMQLVQKMQVLPLTKQLTNLAGNLWSRTLTGARSERNEYLLMHEFHDQKFVVPDKYMKSWSKMITDQGEENEDGEEAAPAKKGGRRKPAYAGGLVLEPKKGFYDKFVLLLDFNSLYPSIIQEYNICFTTVSRNVGEEEDQLPDVPDHDLPRGILPRLIATLVDRRRMVKSLMKSPKISPAEYAQYDIRQKALKLTANSMYGCLGFSNSRFYAKPLAMLITAKGREILQNTVELAEQENLEVIYGDTDSIMIHTNTTDIAAVKKIGNEFKKAVNKRYNLLEIEMDGMFQKLLLLKKKKYASITVEEKNGQVVTAMETKGLDLVRRDWCGLSHDVSSYVLNQLFGPGEKEEIVEAIHTYLGTVGTEVRAGLVPLEKFVINKALTKNPEDYADKLTQPHVQVALRMKSMGGQTARTGETIPYVICKSTASALGSGLIAANAYHPDEVNKEGSGLVVDVEWYLSNQVYPPVSRLCTPIDSTDSARLASCLGLDASKYNTSISASGADSGVDDLYTLSSQLSDAERFKDVYKWSPRCISCSQNAAFPLGGIRFLAQGVKSGLTCPNDVCGATMSVWSLEAQLAVCVRQEVSKFMVGWVVCDDATCRHRTREVSVLGRRCLMTGCKGAMHLEYSDSELYTQLIYFDRLFDLSVVLEDKDHPFYDQIVDIASRDAGHFEVLRRIVQRYLEKNARGFVDLADIFSFCTIAR